MLLPHTVQPVWKLFNCLTVYKVVSFGSVEICFDNVLHLVLTLKER